MSRNLRHILMIAQAVLVVAMGVQSVLNTSHHYGPSTVGAYSAEATFAIGEAQPYSETEDASAQQHEHETTVDHAMIGPSATPAFPPLRSGAGCAPASAELPAGHPVTMPDRPPRRALTA